MKVLRSDAVVIAYGLGYKNAKRWKPKEMRRKFADIAELAVDSTLELDESEVEDDVERERLNRLLLEVVTSDDGVEFVEELEEVEVGLVDEEVVGEAEVVGELAEEEPVQEEVTSEPEPAKKKKQKRKGERKKKVLKEEKRPSSYGVAFDAMCKNPDMTHDELQSLLEAAGLYKKSSVGTAYVVVRKVVANLRSNGLMEQV